MTNVKMRGNTAIDSTNINRKEYYEQLIAINLTIQMKGAQIPWKMQNILVHSRKNRKPKQLFLWKKLHLQFKISRSTEGLDHQW